MCNVAIITEMDMITLKILVATLVIPLRMLMEEQNEMVNMRLHFRRSEFTKRDFQKNTAYVIHLHNQCTQPLKWK